MLAECSCLNFQGQLPILVLVVHGYLFVALATKVVAGISMPKIKKNTVLNQRMLMKIVTSKWTISL